MSGASKLLFSIPSCHDVAFTTYLQSLLPPRSHPLLHRGKNLFFIPDVETIRRFDISVRVCGVGEFVLIDNNVWHAGINIGPNCSTSISVNIIGAGGVEALQKDIACIMDDIHDQRQRMIQFSREWARGRTDRSDEEWRVDWNHSNEAHAEASQHLQLYDTRSSHSTCTTFVRSLRIASHTPFILPCAPLLLVRFLSVACSSAQCQFVSGWPGVQLAERLFTRSSHPLACRRLRASFPLVLRRATVSARSIHISAARRIAAEWRPAGIALVSRTTGAFVR